MTENPKRPVVARRATLLLVVLAILLVPIPALHTTGSRDIVIDASQYEYSPSRLNINRGDTVNVTLAASDVVHGFYLDGYEIDARIEPGISQQFTFTADRSGKFRYRCSVSCGPLHPFMIGELVVGPNEPLWRASALAVAAAAALLLGARKRRSA